MSEAKISVIIKEPGRKPRHVAISPSLANLQKWVGGYIEIVTIATDMVLICNEEGKLMGLPDNVTMLGDTFVGTVILCGTKGEDLTDLPITFAQAKRLLPQMFEVEGDV